jgi:nucleotidyltransferase/DNA polymerase involved in DNA repair
MQMLPVPVVVVFGLPPPDGVSSSSAPRRVAGIHAGDPVRQLRVDGGVHAADPVRVHPGDAVVEQRRVPALHPVETAGVQPVDTVEPHHLYGVHTGDPLVKQRRRVAVLHTVKPVGVQPVNTV